MTATGIPDPNDRAPVPAPHPRDVTRALRSVQQAEALLAEVMDALREAVTILTNIDARTTSRDPSVVAHEREVGE